MNWTSLAEQFREWTAEMKRTREAARSGPASTDFPEWYTGLEVSPASFSRQLGDMQTSLLKANAPEATTVPSGRAAA
jgi:hypothetical protein